MNEISEKAPPTNGKWVGDVWGHVGVVLHCADNGRYGAHLIAGGYIVQLDDDDRLAYVCEIARRLNQWQQEHGNE